MVEDALTHQRTFRDATSRVASDFSRDTPMMTGKESYTTGSVTSKDGSPISYRQLGNGPGLVLIHGGLQASQNLMALAVALSDAFTLYLPDRRGRGKSGSCGPAHGIRTECEDIEALVRKTGARRIFGLS